MPFAMTERIIYHICRTEAWSAAEAAGYYVGSTADRTDGYIHFATAAQIESVAERSHAGESGLVLLAVDAVHLGADLRWEPSGGGDLYPHLYTRMASSAVIAVRPLPVGPDGRHRFPTLGPDGFA